MAIRMSKLAPGGSPRLTPALAITFVAFFLSILWTIYMSFTRSRRLPDYFIDFTEWGRQYARLFNDDAWTTSLKNLIVLGVGSALAIVFGFVLAAMIDNREKRGEGFFRTIFLYPLAVSLIVTGLVWRWMFNPSLGIENFLHEIGWQSASFNWLATSETAMYGIILASVWQSTGFYMALMLAGLKSINTEIWSAARLDGVSFWRLYLEIIVPMMKFTFLTCAILLSLGVVKAYDIVVAMTNGGPGTSTWTPAYFAINAYSIRSNIGFASAAAVIMLLITVIFLPLILVTVWQIRRRKAAAHERRGRWRRRRRAVALSAAQRRRGIDRRSGIAIIVFLTICAAFFCVPLYVIIVTSFKTMEQITLGEIFSLPTTWTLEPWSKAWNGLCTGLDCNGIRTGFFNSVKILFPSLFLSIGISSVTGYALALWNVRWAGPFLFILFICAFVPFQIIMIPLILLVSSGIYGTVWAVAIVHAILSMPLLTLIFRNFYKDIPRGADERGDDGLG